MARVILLLLIYIFSFNVGICSTVVSSQSAVAPQMVSFEACNKIFSLPAEKLFYISLASANANRFTIEEIQSKNGYIRFLVSQREFIASVARVDATHSVLKITPCNNSYYFPIGIPMNFFKYVELNLNMPVVVLN